MSELEFDDFKKEFLEYFEGFFERIRGIEELLFSSLDEITNKKSGMLTIITDSLHERDDLMGQAFEMRDERLEKLEDIALVSMVKLMGHINDGPVSAETKREFAKYLGYDWNKTVENFMALTPSKPAEKDF